METPLLSAFSTENISEKLQFGAWREAISMLYSVDLLESDRKPEFYASLNLRRMGSVIVGDCSSERQTFVREKMKIDQDGVDGYMVQVFTKGSCLVIDQDQPLIMHPGDICIFDNAQELQTVNEDFHLCALMVPRSMLAALISDSDNRHYSCIRAHDPMASLLRSHLLELNSIKETLSVSQGNMLVEPTLNLIAATLNGTPHNTNKGEESLKLAIMIRIKRYIDAHIHNPAFNQDNVLQEFGVSRTRLYKLFDYTGGIALYIRNRRLRLALSSLCDPAQNHRKIIDIAMSAGFSSETSFIRAFKRRYGISPSEARHESSFTLPSLPHPEDENQTLAWWNWLRDL